MYHQTDKKAAVREIQRYLFSISDVMYTEIPRVPIDGVFDEETAAAVRIYQSIKGLNSTGKVDYESFLAMQEDYAAITEDERTRDFIIGDTEFPIGVGSISEDVRTLHLMINELAKSFSAVLEVGTGAYYSTRTAASVEALRELFRYPPAPFVDKQLFIRMDSELKARRRAKEKYL